MNNERTRGGEDGRGRRKEEEMENMRGGEKSGRKEVVLNV